MKTDILEVNPYKDVLIKEIENASSDEDLETVFRVMDYVQSVQMKATIAGYTDSAPQDSPQVTQKEIEKAQQKEANKTEDPHQAAQELWEKLVGKNKRDGDDNSLT